MDKDERITTHYIRISIGVTTYPNTICKCAQHANVHNKPIHVHTFNPTSPMEPLSPRLPTAPANPYKIYPHKSTIRMQNYTYRNARKSPSASSTYWPRRPIRTLQEEKINSSKYFYLFLITVQEIQFDQESRQQSHSVRAVQEDPVKRC